MLLRLFVFFIITCSYFPTENLQEQDTYVNVYKVAEKLFYEKKFIEAENKIKFILPKIDLLPYSIQSKIYSLLGDLSFFQKKYEASIKFYENALTFSEDSSLDNFRMGQAYLCLKQYESARLYFQRSYDIKSNLKINLFQLGYISLMYDRNKQDTIRYWKSFIEDNMQDPQYESIKKAIALLMDENFIIPPKDSSISLEEVLLLGDAVQENKTEIKDAKIGDEKSKENNHSKELLEDESL